MRKSITICKGVRLNLGKKGVGVSFGTKGLRYSINSSGRKTTTVGIPGTGISYSKSSGSRNYSSSAYSTRTQLQGQREQQKQNELQQNRLAVQQYENLVGCIKGVHKECDDYVDWTHINAVEPPFPAMEQGPNGKAAIGKVNTFVPNFIEKIFKSLGEKRLERLKNAVVTAIAQDEEDYRDWEALNELSSRILQGDIDAYLKVVDEMKPFDDLLEFGSDFEVGAETRDTLQVEFRVKSGEVVPNYVLSLTQTGKLSRKDMTKTNYYDFVQDYVCSCAIRIARDCFALLPLTHVVIHAVDNCFNPATGYPEDVTILSVAFEKDQLSFLNFQAIDPSEALLNFRHNMKFLKTAGFKPVDRIEI